MTSRTILTLANGRGLDMLKAFPLVYLATPYSKYAAGLHDAFKDAAALAGKLLTAGIKIYSPIAHTHPIAIYGDLDPLDHKIWMPFDKVMMTVSHALLVAQMPGWRESYGIGEEIKFFGDVAKPTFYLDPATLDVAAEPLEID